MQVQIKTKSALDLPLSGSVGTFKVGDNTGKGTLEVKYLLTHVGLDLSDSQNHKLLEELVPVREMFDVTNLEFDEIMQRDIDDARISAEMIPYLLDDKTQGTVKFFPPIVVICLPIKNDRNKPSPYYPKLIIEKNNDEGGGTGEGWYITQSGEKGSEVFKFKQPIVNKKPSQHDLVEFSVNRSKSRLVIIDGQHRAMALLALYRNLKNDWSDAKRTAYKSYYEEWTNDYIERFNLDDIQLPMIICTIPELQQGFSEDFDLKKACRSIFLTLNKNAKKVSTTRNLLLNDNDLISSFMRRTLSEIKTFNNRSSSHLAIHCVELDQDENKIKITNDIAITGVSHLYYMIEHVMLNEDGISGISNRDGTYSTRVQNSKISKALSRLNCYDLLGRDSTNNIRRDLFKKSEEEKLVNSFFEKYGTYIVEIFSNFSVFDASNKAANSLKSDLQSHKNVQLEPMLFDGQGMIRTFESHYDNLKKRSNEGEFNNTPRIKSMIDTLNSTKNSLSESINSFKKYRAENLLENYRPKLEDLDKNNNSYDSLLVIINNLYDDLFRTVAFQCALFATYFDIYEKYIANKDDPNINNHDDGFQKYLSSISNFFSPKTFKELKKLIGIFVGNVSENSNSVKNLEIAGKTPDTFRQVVYPQEMKPNAWPVYRYLLLEIWSLADNEVFTDVIKKEIQIARQAVANNLYKRTKDEYKRENSKHDDDFNSDDQQKVKDKVIKNYKNLMKYFNKHSEISEELITI